MADVIFSAFVSDMVSRGISLLFEHFGHQKCTEAQLQQCTLLYHMLIKDHSVVDTVPQHQNTVPRGSLKVEVKGRQIANDGTIQWLSPSSLMVSTEYQGWYLLDTIRNREHELEEDEHGGDKVAPPRVFSTSVFNPLKHVL